MNCLGVHVELACDWRTVIKDDYSTFGFWIPRIITVEVSSLRATVNSCGPVLDPRVLTVIQNWCHAVDGAGFVAKSFGCVHTRVFSEHHSTCIRMSCCRLRWQYISIHPIFVV